MTIAREGIERLTPVAVVLAFVLVDMGCGEGEGFVEGFDTAFVVEVSVMVMKLGDGTGRVTSSDITRPSGEVISLDCGPSESECTIRFDDSGGMGTLTLTATPDPGSVHSGWAGSTCPSNTSPATVCGVSAANGTAALEFESTQDLEFDVKVTFNLGVGPPPPVPTDLIAFESFRGSNRDIYVIKPDKTELMRLTTNSAQDYEPAWSPAGTKIAFVSARAPHAGKDEIYAMLDDAMSQDRLTNLLGSNRRPAYSPDGAKIAFDNNGDGDREIFVMNFDGTNPQQLTDNGDLDQGPSWSPNSTQIVFTSFRDGRDNLYVMNADGKGQTLLVDTGRDDYQPDWSPDGARIVFTSQDADGDDEIFIVDADGMTNLKQLTFNTVADREATWSSDSKWIAFASDQGGNRDIYIMTPDGLNVMRVTEDAANDSRPSWVH